MCKHEDSGRQVHIAVCVVEVRGQRYGLALRNKASGKSSLEGNAVQYESGFIIALREQVS